MSRVLVEHKTLFATNDVCVITISDVQSRNSLTEISLKAFARAIGKASSSSEEGTATTRCVILTGDGEDAFSSGINLSAAKRVFRMSEEDYESDPVHAMETSRVPILCVVNGAAINAGFEIALAADVILVTKNARFIDVHMELGLMPSWGLSSKLSRAIGINNAKLFSVFGETLNGEEAVRLGLAQKKVFDSKSDAMEEAIRLAGKMIEKSRSKERARVALEIIDEGWKKAYGEARRIEREKAFAQYRSLPLEDMFKSRRRDKSGGGGELRSKL